MTIKELFEKLNTLPYNHKGIFNCGKELFLSSIPLKFLRRNSDCFTMYEYGEKSFKFIMKDNKVILEDWSAWSGELWKTFEYLPEDHVNFLPWRLTSMLRDLKIIPKSTVSVYVWKNDDGGSEFREDYFEIEVAGQKARVNAFGGNPVTWERNREKYIEIAEEAFARMPEEFPYKDHKNGLVIADLNSSYYNIVPIEGMNPNEVGMCYYPVKRLAHTFFGMTKDLYRAVHFTDGCSIEQLVKGGG